MKVDLSKYTNPEFDRGRSKVFELLWLFVQTLLITSWIPGALHRRVILRLFGAKIGKGVDIKPGVKIKFPWKLKIAAYSWIGEDVWIDNLAPVTISSNCCISQGAYLCTGSHNWSSETFDLITEPIKIEDSSWVCASAVVGPGVTIRQGAILALGSTTTHDLEPWTIYKGSPCKNVGKRSEQQKFAA